MNTKKRIELYLWILIFFAGLHISGTAQSLQLSNNTGFLSDGESIRIRTYFNTAGFLMLGVTNTTDSLVNVMVEKEELVLPPSIPSENYFYWGQDYGPSDYVSHLPVKIPPSVTESFIGWFDAFGYVAWARIKYRFYVEGAPEDNVSVVVTYDNVLWNDIPQEKETTPGLSAYPNPAGMQVTFAYGLPEEAKDAEVVIYNATGVVVKNIRLPLHDNEYTVNIEDLSSGMYFYHVVVDGNRSQTKKLSVQH